MTSFINDRVATPSSGSDKSLPSDTQKGSLGGTGLETRDQEERLVLEKIWWKTSSQDLHLIPRIYIFKKLNMAACVCNSGTGRQDRQILEAHWPARLVHLSSPRPARDPV